MQKKQPDQHVSIDGRYGMENVNTNNLNNRFFTRIWIMGMRDYSFYSAIMGLSSDWHIADVTVDNKTGITELHIRNKGAGKGRCPTCGADAVAEGTRTSRWLHENHLNIRLLISALIPILTCKHCGKTQMSVPWERPAPPLEID